MSAEGIIKFHYKCTSPYPLEVGRNLFKEINMVRNKLYRMGYIGQDSNGLGYGNISMRHPSGKGFYITASGTGTLKILKKRHYVWVNQCDLIHNSCTYAGMLKPSSESLSHYVIYKELKDIRSVIHIHNHELWHKLQGRIPETPHHISYGSLDMANKIASLVGTANGDDFRIILLKGHPDGLISFGESPEKALEEILKTQKS